MAGKLDSGAGREPDSPVADPGNISGRKKNQFKANIFDNFDHSDIFFPRHFSPQLRPLLPHPTSSSGFVGANFSLRGAGRSRIWTLQRIFFGGSFEEIPGRGTEGPARLRSAPPCRSPGAAAIPRARSPFLSGCGGIPDPGGLVGSGFGERFLGFV